MPETPEITVNNTIVDISELEEQLLAHNLTEKEAENRAKNFAANLQSSKKLQAAKKIRIEIDEKEKKFMIFIDDEKIPIICRSVVFNDKVKNPKEE